MTDKRSVLVLNLSSMKLKAFCVHMMTCKRNEGMLKLKMDSIQDMLFLTCLKCLGENSDALSKTSTKSRSKLVHKIALHINLPPTFSSVPWLSFLCVDVIVRTGNLSGLSQHIVITDLVIIMHITIFNPNTRVIRPF